MLDNLRQILLGPPRDPLNKDTRRGIALAAFLAWIGLGSDGLSSANYGPAEAYLALAQHTNLGLFVAIGTAVTIFIIALGYNQVIELFPNGGGGYKVATTLLGPYAGLAAGCALVIDYVLTIAISVAAGADALFSLLPLSLHGAKLPTAALLIGLLAWLNLRGAKESIRMLMPIFLGFLISHIGLIVYGIARHGGRLPDLMPASLDEASAMAAEVGWLVVLSIILRAYSLGAGTYTGIEAVSNNVQILAEPRVRTGRLTMLYMAFTLAFVATGLMLLYLLSDVAPVQGQTLNAVAFRSLIGELLPSAGYLNEAALVLVLTFAAAILFVAANTGFLGGPAVLANMATDEWVPHQFSHLSSRLVAHFGVVLMAVAAVILLVAVGGEVAVLVVLYSINVFICFSLSLAGLTVYWLRHRRQRRDWPHRFALSAVGFVFTTTILFIVVTEKFGSGAWLSLLSTGLLAAGCVAVHRHYRHVRRQLRAADALLRRVTRQPHVPAPVEPDPSQPTAVLLVGPSYGAGMHTLLAIERMFPAHFKTFVFASVGEVDSHSYGAEARLRGLQRAVGGRLKHFVDFCHARGCGTAGYQAFGTDVVGEIVALSRQIVRDFPNAVFFAPRLVLPRESWITRLLHNQTALIVQRRLHLLGIQMMIVPMRIESNLGQTKSVAR